MEFEFKGQRYTLPSLLSEITLGKRVDFHTTYGEALDTRARTIMEMEEGTDKDIEVSQWHIDSAVESFSFFSGIPLDIVKAEIELSQLLPIYQANLSVLLEQSNNVETKPEYEWKDAVWTIAPPELLPDSTMTFNEFLASKEIVRQLSQLGKGKWESLIYLCAIYFRKVGEPYDEAFVMPDSERMKLMSELPLDYALAVGFFLTDTMSIYLSTFPYSESQEQKEESTPAPTSTGGDG